MAARNYKEVYSITISQIIALCDSLRPNSFPQELKESWLRELDSKVSLELFAKYESCPQQGTELLIPQPFGRDIYCFYLQSCMDRENGETGRYNQSAALFNDSFEAFKSHCIRENLPLSPGGFKLRGDTICQGCPF